MSKLCISLFGKFKVTSSSGGIVTPEARRAKELFSYLLLYRDRLHEREKLATMMWAEQSTTRAKQYLRQTLWQVQSGLPLAPGEEPLLLANQERIGINPQAELWLDVAEFDQVYALVERIPGSALQASQVELMRASLPLYRGDLLEGCYEDWCTFERERYLNRYLAVLDKLLVYCEAHQEYHAALAYGAQILHYDRARERTHRSLMRLYYLAGDRTAALHQYEACVTALAEELDVAPAKSTVSLYQQICADQIAAEKHKVAAPADHRTNTPAGDTLDQLSQIQTTLSQLQVQVSTLIEFIAQAPAESS